MACSIHITLHAETWSCMHRLGRGPFPGSFCFQPSRHGVKASECRLLRIRAQAWHHAPQLTAAVRTHALLLRAALCLWLCTARPFPVARLLHSSPFCASVLSSAHPAMSRRAKRGRSQSHSQDPRARPYALSRTKALRHTCCWDRLRAGHTLGGASVFCH